MHALENHAEQPPKQSALGRVPVIALFLSALATVHLVLFYIIRVPAYIRLDLYEQGLERMPFQGRVLMRYPLLWAHHSTYLNRAAQWLTSMRIWVPYQILPEQIAEFGIDVVAVAIAGIVALELYRGCSTRARLRAYAYPLLLVMVAGSYCLVSMNFFRYYYDLPSLGLFAAGLYFIYRRQQDVLFALIFLVATINRETSLFLLLLFVQHRCMRAGHFDWRTIQTFRVGGVATLLGLCWWCVHHEMTRRFGVPPNNIKPGVTVNLVVSLSPFAWPQIAGIGLYTVPLLLLLLVRRPTLIKHPAFTWFNIMPVWVVVMFLYGDAVEIRLFGEFLPLVTCAVLVACEAQLFEREVPRAVESVSGSLAA